MKPALTSLSSLIVLCCAASLTVGCKPVVTCGDGKWDASEECDGSAETSCIALGFAGGTLSCGGTCQYDTSRCTGYSPACGNEALDTGEECDPPASDDATCESLGFTGGEVRCNHWTCRRSVVGCYECGNRIIETPHEECDGDSPDGRTCESLGFSGGVLACSSTCTLDTSACTGTPGTCGNGAIDVPAEECDAAQLGDRTCENLGFVGGTLTCLACALDTSGCTGYSPACGNGTLDVGEYCDPPIGGDGATTCESVGFEWGELGCNPWTCSTDTAACVRREQKPEFTAEEAALGASRIEPLSVPATATANLGSTAGAYAFLVEVLADQTIEVCVNASAPTAITYYPQYSPGYEFVDTTPGCTNIRNLDPLHINRILVSVAGAGSPVVTVQTRAI